MALTDERLSDAHTHSDPDVLAWLVARAALPASSAVPADQTQNGLVGQPAPPLDTRAHLGPRLPSIAQLQGRVVAPLLLGALVLGVQGHESDARACAREVPNRRGSCHRADARYGYVTEGRAAAPDRNFVTSCKSRRGSYPFLKREPVPSSEANAERYAAGRCAEGSSSSIGAGFSRRPSGTHDGGGARGRDSEVALAVGSVWPATALW